MFNVDRRHEPVATDTISSTVLALGGYKYAQIFVGRKSCVVDVYPMKSSKEFVNTLQDVIRQRGAMDKLISDRASVEISKQVLDILRALVIQDWQSEPHYQHQNFAERHWQTMKRITHTIMDRTNAPPEMWLLCLQYVAYILNRMSLPSLKNKAPLTMLRGEIPDISAIPIYMFYQPVYFLHYQSETEPLHKTREKLGHFVGFAENVGHALTFKVFNPESRQILYRSRLRIDEDGEKNLRAAAPPPSTDGETSRPRPTIYDPDVDPPGADDGDSPSENADENIPEKPPFKLSSPYDQKLADGKLLPTIDPELIVGKTFQLPPDPKGNITELTAVEMITQYEDDVYKNPEHVKFRCTIGDKEYADLISYTKVLDYLEDDTNRVYNFRKIITHQGPLKKGDADYLGSMWNLLIQWEDYDKPTVLPLKIMIRDDWSSAVEYAEANNLLDKPGWRQLRGKAKSKEYINRNAHATKVHSPRFSPVYQFGVRVPRNHAEAMLLDKENGNTYWADAEFAELTSIQGFQSLRSVGHKDNTKPPPGYKKINVRFVYAVKHDGRHKARLVAGGHLTDTPVESVYSSVCSLKGVRMTIFVGLLNGHLIYCTDVGNAYLESYTKEKVYVIGGPEFAPFGLEGHILLIERALYGLKSSGLRWWERLAEVLREIGFFNSKAETDIWMRRVDDHYEYICVYVDDLVIASKDPQAIVDMLSSRYSFSFKGTGPIHYHLGCDYFKDHNGTQCYGPKRYIDKMVEDFTRMFGEKPRPYSSPLERGDHPEVDQSAFLDLEGIKQYQSMIGSLQWAVQLGRLDITTAVMSLSSFRVAPRQGHLNRAKRIIGYLVKKRNAVIRIRTDLPDFTAMPHVKQPWETSIYQGAQELIPDDIPVPLGKPVRCTSYVDANLYHDMLTGRSVTGVLHIFNQTPIDWYSKKQATVETATYGSEFVAARTAVEQIIANRLALRYLGVTVDGPTILFGDNRSVIDSTSVPHSQLNRRHMALSYHKVREAIAAGIVRFEWIESAENPADILSKHWGLQQVAPLLHALLFMPSVQLVG